MSQLKRLWHFSSSINSKCACAAIQWGYMSDFWSDPSSTSILHVCEQRRLWRDWAFAGCLCDKYQSHELARCKKVVLIWQSCKQFGDSKEINYCKSADYLRIRVCISLPAWRIKQLVFILLRICWIFISLQPCWSQQMQLASDGQKISLRIDEQYFIENAYEFCLLEYASCILK